MDQYIYRFNNKHFTFICDGVCPTFRGSFSAMEVTSFNICHHGGIWIEKPKLKYNQCSNKMLSMIDEFDKKKDIHLVDNNGDKRPE